MSKFSKIVVGGKKYKQYRNEVEQQMRLLLPIAIRMAMTVSLEDVRMFFFKQNASRSETIESKTIEECVD